MGPATPEYDSAHLTDACVLKNVHSLRSIYLVWDTFCLSQERREPQRVYFDESAFNLYRCEQLWPDFGNATN